MSKVSKAKKDEEISFTRKCLLMAKISQEKNMVLINSFKDIPFVTLYTAKLNQEYFVSSNVSGAFCFFTDNNPEKKKIYFRIYNIYNISLVFQMELKDELIKEYSKLNDCFYTLCTKYFTLGFKFKTKESAEKFFKLINEKPDSNILEENIKTQNTKVKDFNKALNQITNEVKNDINHSCKSIVTGNKTIDRGNKVYDLTVFEQLIYYLNNFEYDDYNGRFNFFIENNNYKRLYKNIIDQCNNVKDKESFPLKIIYNDYTHITNKNFYIHVLVENIMNNLKMMKRFAALKREYKKKLLKKLVEGEDNHNKEKGKALDIQSLDLTNNNKSSPLQRSSTLKKDEILRHSTGEPALQRTGKIKANDARQSCIIIGNNKEIKKGSGGGIFDFFRSNHEVIKEEIDEDENKKSKKIKENN